jgi:uncharacterized protein
MRKLLIVFVIFLLFPVIAAAKQGHMVLLAVKEGPLGYTGSAADLYLEVRPGTGRVFIETLPLSKLDTQISTRFAKDIACDFLDEDCSQYDFFYTIKAKSSIIGGPSAGAAISVLTVAILEDLPMDEGVAITGTINSGGLIGPVSGLRAKIDAAAEINVSKVLIPKGERYVKEVRNFTIDLQDYGKKYDIEVEEVSDLIEAVYEFTGERFKEIEVDLEVNEKYKEVMKSLAVELCNRTENLQKEVYASNVDISVIDEDFVGIEESAVNFSEKADKAFEDEMHYSAASYCFGANVNYRSLLIRISNLTDFESVKENIKIIDTKVEEKEILTITDLEAYMIVKERIKDAEDLLEKAEYNYEKNGSYIRYLARANERIYSAESWSWFFGFPGKEFKFDKESLKSGCLVKLSEAEERYQYANLFFPDSLKETKEEIDYAYDDLEKGDYELCLFKASKAKAEADIILSVIGVEETQVDTLIANKLKIVERVIAEQDVFPILGYSYYEYADSLKDDDKYASLLYSEYALELSNLDLYFEEKGKIQIKIDEGFLLFLSGIVVGVLIMLIFRRKKHKRKRA